MGGGYWFLVGHVPAGMVVFIGVVVGFFLWSSLFDELCQGADGLREQEVPQIRLRLAHCRCRWPGGQSMGHPCL